MTFTETCFSNSSAEDILLALAQAHSCKNSTVSVLPSDVLPKIACIVRSEQQEFLQSQGRITPPATPTPLAQRPPKLSGKRRE